MDPLWAVLAEVWWIGPTVVGAGALGWLGVRHQRAENARRLEYDAARHELRAARSGVASARVTVKVARAELSRAQAERAAGRASAADVAAARKHLQHAERDARAATATVRVGKAHVTAARSALPTSGDDPAKLPLARLLGAHDAVTARWLEYETDPAKLIAFPAMTDVREPATAAYLDARRTAQELRPATPQTRMSPAQFALYRDAVRDLERAFDAAEDEAWGQARRAGTVPPEPTPATPHWSDVAQSVAETVWTRGVEAIIRVTESRTGRTDAAAASDDSPSDRSAEAPRSETPPPESAQPPQQPASDPPRQTGVWPVPRRSAPPSGGAGGR